MSKSIVRWLYVSVAASLLPLGILGAAGAAAAAQRPLITRGLTPNGLQAVSCASATSCIAVGADSLTSATSSALAESWNGKSWTVLKAAEPSGETSSYLLGVSCVSSKACTAVGYYDKSDGLTFVMAESWNGSKWTMATVPFPSGSPNNFLTAVSCSSTTSCVAVGYAGDARFTPSSLAETWNGKTWTVEVTPNPSGTATSFLTGVSCPTSKYCLAVGYWDSNTGTVRTLSESWNGAKWALGTPPVPKGAMSSQLTGVSCTSAASCVAVSNWVPSKTGSGDYVAGVTWNGKAWAVTEFLGPAASGNSSLYWVSCSSAKACTAVGSYLTSKGTALPFAALWNGSKWANQTTPDPAKSSGANLVGVSCPAAATCVAAGTYETGGKYVTLGEGWNGSKWAVQTTPN